MASVGMQLIKSILLSTDKKQLASLSNVKRFLTTTENEVYDLLHLHFQKHGQYPALSTMQKEIDAITLMALEKAEVEEPPSYYLDLAKNRYVYGSLVKMVNDVRTVLSDDEGKKNPGVVLDQALDSLSAIILHSNSDMVIDFKESFGLIIAEYKKKLSEGTQYGINLGWPHLDSLSGGLVGGDVLSIVGRPALGKTWLTLYAALNAWKAQEKTVAFVTMEMNPVSIVQRLAAMYTHKNISEIKTGTLTTAGMQKFSGRLKELKDEKSSLWVVNGAEAATVNEMAVLFQHLKPDAIFIDGAYLITPDNKKLDRFARVADTATAIKNRLAVALNVPVICSYQLNRSSIKALKKDEQVGIEHIGYADEIGQLSSVVLGLFEEESVSTLQKRRVMIMKGRSGETGQFDINWDFMFMDFSQFDPSKLSITNI